jgi:hypothetical protein
LVDFPPLLYLSVDRQNPNVATLGFRVDFTTVVDSFPFNHIPIESIQKFQEPSGFLPLVSSAVNTDTLVEKLQDLCPATTKPVRYSSREHLWHRWVSQHLDTIEHKNPTDLGGRLLYEFPCSWLYPQFERKIFIPLFWATYLPNLKAMQQ